MKPNKLICMCCYCCYALAEDVNLELNIGSDTYLNDDNVLIEEKQHMLVCSKCGATKIVAECLNCNTGQVEIHYGSWRPSENFVTSLFPNF